jgi:hypothetical protein
VIFFLYCDSQTEVRFEKIKTRSKFGGKKSKFEKARFVKPSDEQVKRPHEIITQSNEISATNLRLNEILECLSVLKKSIQT